MAMDVQGVRGTPTFVLLDRHSYRSHPSAEV